MKICEVFYSIQGEIDIGRPALFIRTGGCNLNCGFCDTNYAKDEHYDMKLEDVFEKAKHFDRIVITGGEPMLYWDEIKQLSNKLIKNNPDTIIEIETNGTISPTNFKNAANFKFNVSLKLKNSGNRTSERLNSYSINTFKKLSNVRYKFVIDTEDDVDEVNMIISKYGLDKKQIYLMPLGDTKQLQLDNMNKVVMWCKRFKYNFTPRLHLLIWDKKRGV